MTCWTSPPSRSRPSSRTGLFTYPDPVDEVSARLVAAGVVAMSVATIALDLRWLVPLIAYGFVARVLTGPSLSPLGQLVTRVRTPALDRPATLVPGPPKRVIPDDVCERGNDIWATNP